MLISKPSHEPGILHLILSSVFLPCRYNLLYRDVLPHQPCGMVGASLPRGLELTASSELRQMTDMSAIPHTPKPACGYGGSKSKKKGAAKIQV